MKPISWKRFITIVLLISTVLLLGCFKDKSNHTPPTSSPQSRIAFDSDLEGFFQIYVMNADGSDQTRLTHSEGFDTMPCWSPDGTEIAFVSIRQPRTEPEKSHREIYVMSADGSNTIRITNNEVVDESPSWTR